MAYNIEEILENFSIVGDYVTSEPYGSGHINDTFAVYINLGGKEVRYILQRINHEIFKNPEQLMDNISRVTRHIGARLKASGCKDTTRRVLTVINTIDGKPVFKDSDGNYWRVYVFIENATGYDIIENEEQAFQAARAFGLFQKELVDLPGERLHETIPNFHNTISRYERFEEVLKADVKGRAAEAKAEIDFFLENKDVASHLLKLNEQGLIPERITHNDTKLNNVLLDNETNEGICCIDLDTVMPGLGLYDFGDLIRTSTSPAAEDEKDVSKVTMQMNMFEALVKGYLDAASDFLTEAEIENLPFSGKLITFEIGLRFITDFLEGDVYFKTHHEGHNLDRCRTQIALVKSIDNQLDEMNACVASTLESLKKN